MLDINNIRNKFDETEKNFQNRKMDTSILKNARHVDKLYREELHKLEDKRAELNKKSKQIGELKRNKQNCDKVLKDLEKLSKEIKKLDITTKELKEELIKIMLIIPNQLNNKVPVGKDSTDNVEVSRWGVPRKFNFIPKAHWEIGNELDIIDISRAVKISGSRFAIFKNEGSRLARALINFMLDIHVDSGYQEMETPVIVNEQSLISTGNLPKFEGDLYKITKNDFYLIPTAEVTMTNYHRNEILKEDNLPLKYTAYTPCFRSEAGSAGKDTKGIIRLHQFDKVEMVNITAEDDSDIHLNNMVQQASKILKELNLPHRIMLLCSGDTGFASSITYDLEVWLPSYNDYKEISSCSNCSDFQSRRANIKYKSADNLKFVHTLNGSGLAVGRTIAAILENFQNEDGSISIPEKLVPYMNGINKLNKNA